MALSIRLLSITYPFAIPSFGFSAQSVGVTTGQTATGLAATGSKFGPARATVHSISVTGRPGLDYGDIS